MSAFPAVATVIGVSKEVAESGPLLATLAVDPNLMVPPPAPPMELMEPETPVDIKAGDPVTQAVVDNIIGKLPTKKEPVQLKCEVCNITVSSPEILQAHYSGSKHAKKLKGQELIKEITSSPNSPFVVAQPLNGATSASEFTCKICNVRVNSYHQLQQHLSGTKHKTKAESSKSNTVEIVDNSGANKGVVSVDIGPNRLYCAACNVHVNSDLQLHQHITSNKHANKVNGKASFNRGAPYSRRPARGKTWNAGNDWGRVGSRPAHSGGWTPNGNGRPAHSGGWTPNGNGRPAHSGGWTPNGAGPGLGLNSGARLSPYSMPPHKAFVPGGRISGY